jgi:DNA-binding response OmpR family regulator
VLFAEDDDAVVRLVTLQLQQEGFEVLHYPNGALALKAAAESGAALVISDVEMPEMDGLSFLRELRRLPACRHVPVMMLTAMGDEQYIVQAFELGADEYVVKPFSMNELVARIRRLLRRQSISGQLSAAAP